MSESATVNVAEERTGQAVGSKLLGRVALVTGGTGESAPPSQRNLPRKVRLLQPASVETSSAPISSPKPSPTDSQPRSAPTAATSLLQTTAAGWSTKSSSNTVGSTS
jgi:hypothetical protein